MHQGEAISKAPGLKANIDAFYAEINKTYKRISKNAVKDATKLRFVLLCWFRIC